MTGIGARKEVGIESFGNLFMIGEFLAVITCNRMGMGFNRLHQFQKRFFYDICLFSGHLLHQGELRVPVYYRNNSLKDKIVIDMLSLIRKKIKATGNQRE